MFLLIRCVNGKRLGQIKGRIDSYATKLDDLKYLISSL